MPEMDDYVVLDDSASGVRGQAHGVSGPSDSSVSHDDTTIAHNDERNNNNNNETASDHESNRNGGMTVAGGEENNPAGFKVYSGYRGDHDRTVYIGAMSMGGGSHSNNTNNSGALISRIATASGAEYSSEYSLSAAAWSTTATTTTKKKKKGMRMRMGMSSSSTTSRIAVWVPREVGHCGRVHERDTTDWGPGQGWDMSTLPVYRSPASPCNRLFCAIKETRPGRDPKELLERLAYTPQPGPRRNHVPAHLMFGLHNWDPSTSLTPSTRTRKSHPRSQTSSVKNDTSKARRQFRQQNFGHDSPPSKKEENVGKGRGGQQQQLESKRSRRTKDWNFSTTPKWKATSKYNQFENIKDRGRPPRVSNKYTSVKAQYMKPSKKYLKLRKERQLEAQRREDYLSLDMKYCK